MTANIRIASGTSSGLLEVFHDGQWGTVCDDGFSTTNANVACRELGYSSGYMTNATGSGQIWMDGVNCTGTETSLLDCPFNGWGINDCSHSEDVGLSCSN
jgi:hypothetical protein